MQWLRRVMPVMKRLWVWKNRYTISKGQAKIVLVDESGNVSTILERLPENSAEEIITKSVTLKEGKNRIKIVGYNCEDVDLQLLFEEP